MKKSDKIIVHERDDYMKEIPSKYIELHKLTFKNKKTLDDSKKCVCIYCEKEFDVSKITNWIKDQNDLTAQCPYCNVDSVIPKKHNDVEITNEDIKKLNKYYF